MVKKNIKQRAAALSLFSFFHCLVLRENLWVDGCSEFIFCVCTCANVKCRLGWDTLIVVYSVDEYVCVQMDECKQKHNEKAKNTEKSTGKKWKKKHWKKQWKALKSTENSKKEAKRPENSNLKKYEERTTRKNTHTEHKSQKLKNRENTF